MTFEELDNIMEKLNVIRVEDKAHILGVKKRAYQTWRNSRVPVYISHHVEALILLQKTDAHQFELLKENRLNFA